MPTRDQRRRASDPNVDPETLLELLGAGCVEEVFSNPVFDLLLLEAPALLDGLAKLHSEAIASSPRCPPGLVEAAIRYRDEDRIYIQYGLMSRATLPWLCANRALPVERRRAAFCALPDLFDLKRWPNRAQVASEVLSAEEARLLERAVVSEEASLGLSVKEFELLGKLGPATRGLLRTFMDCPESLAGGARPDR